MAAEAQFRCDVAGPEALAALRDAPLPPRLRGAPPTRSFHRDIYLDTADGTLLSRGVSCRLRLRADDRRLLALFIGGEGGRAMAQYKVKFKKSIPSTLVIESIRRSVLPKVVTIDVRDA